MALGTQAASADTYQANVRRVSSNVYQLNGRGLYALTRYCYEYSYGDDVILDWDGYSGKIVWINSNSQCDLKKLLGQASLATGVYKITVSQYADDIYEVEGQDTYILTDACLSLALGSDAYLDWDGVSGKLIFAEGSDRCEATTILKPLR